MFLLPLIDSVCMKYYSNVLGYDFLPLLQKENIKFDLKFDLVATIFKR